MTLVTPLTVPPTPLPVVAADWLMVMAPIRAERSSVSLPPTPVTLPLSSEPAPAKAKVSGPVLPRRLPTPLNTVAPPIAAPEFKAVTLTVVPAVGVTRVELAPLPVSESMPPVAPSASVPLNPLPTMTLSPLPPVRVADPMPVSVVGVGRVSGDILAGQEPLALRLFTVVLIVAGLNVFVGIFNLLPLLPLDGGHLAILVFEKARQGVYKLLHRPDPGRVDLAKLLPAAYVFLVFIIGLSMLLLAADIVNPIKITG